MDKDTKIRLLYSLGDFQQALSAATFLSDECDIKKSYTIEQLRRFRCYETTMVVAYCRPFSKSHAFPQFSFSTINLALSQEQNKIHKKIKRVRNKVFAHSDKALMRMHAQPLPIGADKGHTHQFLDVRFDEGVTFLGDDLEAAIILIRTAICKIIEHIYDDVQTNPADYDIIQDYVDSRIVGSLPHK